MEYAIIFNCNCRDCVNFYSRKQTHELIFYSFTQAVERIIALNMYAPDYMIAPVHEAKVWRE